MHTTTLIFATLLAFTLSAVMLFNTLLLSGKPRALPVCLLIPKYGSASSKLLPLEKLFIGGTSYRLGTDIYYQQSHPQEAKGKRIQKKELGNLKQQRLVS